MSWFIDPDPRGGGYSVIDEATGRGVVFATQRDPHPREGKGITDAEAMRNARLISAAPELLAALTSLLPFVVTEVLEHCDGSKCREQWCAGCSGEESARAAVEKSLLICQQARAVIAKATGEQA